MDDGNSDKETKATKNVCVIKQVLKFNHYISGLLNIETILALQLRF